MKFAYVTAALVLLVLPVECKRVHEFDLSQNDTDSSTGAFKPVSACGLDYHETFDADPLEGRPCTPGNALASWRASPNEFDVPRNPWVWSDQNNLISDTAAGGGYMVIDVINADTDSDTLLGENPTRRVSENLFSPYYDVRGCDEVFMSALHHAQQDGTAPNGNPSPLAGVYYYYIDHNDSSFVFNQMAFFDTDNGLIAHDNGMPLGGHIPSHVSNISWFFNFKGDYSASEKAHWMIDNFAIWGNDHPDCALQTRQSVTFDDDSMLFTPSEPDPARWTCVDSSPPPEKGSSWAWSSQDNNIPNSSGGHLRVTSNYSGTEAGAFSELLSSPIFDVSKCETAIIKLNYSFLREEDELNGLLAPFVRFIVHDVTGNDELKRSIWEDSTSGLYQVELDVKDVEQVRLTVNYRGGSRNPHDFHLKLDDFSIFGTP